MHKMARKLLGMLLAASMLVGSVQVPGTTVQAQEVISESELFTQATEDEMITMEPQLTTDTIKYIRDTDGIDVNEEYIITWNSEGNTERVLFCNAGNANIISLYPNGDEITPMTHSSWGIDTQIWKVLDGGDGNYRLQSTYASATPHYLDLTQPSPSGHVYTPASATESAAPLVSIATAATAGKYVVRGVSGAGTGTYYLHNSGGNGGKWITNETQGAEMTFWRRTVIKTTLLGTDVGNLFTTETGDNIWVFTGGEDVAVSFSKTASARNYIGNFEEYIRYTGSPSGDYDTGKNFRQRYTINMGKDGRTLEEIVTNWDALVAANQPKAVSFFLGEEDYGKGADVLDAFGVQLKSFIDNALALKDDQGFAVIQLPYVTGDSEKDSAADSYIAKVTEVIHDESNGYTTDITKYRRIVVVDHREATSGIANWTQEYLTDGKLNAKGHMAIGRQLCDATIKNVNNNYPNGRNNSSLATQVIYGPESYVNEIPYAIVDGESLLVTIGSDLIDQYGSDYTFEVTQITDTGEKTVLNLEATVKAETAIRIHGLQQDAYWMLQTRAAGGSVQLGTVEGEVTDGNQGQPHKPVAFTDRATEKQQKLAELLETKESVRWLFVGDSITHGCLFTHDYDNTAQLFEKYVKDTLGRTDDVVINTAVAGAIVDDNNREARKEIRLGWNADVVTIMLGTNDAAVSGHSTKEEFITHFNELLTNIEIYNPGAIVVFRLPVYTSQTNSNPVISRAANVIPIVEALKEIANETDESGQTKADFVIDQYETTTNGMKGLNWLATNEYFYASDGVHPNELGQLHMFHLLVDGLGLTDNDSPFTDLSYNKINSTVEKRSKDFTQYLTLDEENNNVTLDVSGLVAQETDLASVTFTLTERDSGESYSVSADRAVILDEINKTSTIAWGENTTLTLKTIPWDRSYQVDVTGWAISSAKEIVLTDALNLGEVESFEITFDSNGGSAVASQTVELYKTVKKPTSPTKEGFTFAGWYIGDVKYDFNTAVTEPVTLTARWYEIGKTSTLENPEVGTSLLLDTKDERYLIYDIIYEDNDNNPVKLSQTPYTRVLYDDGGSTTGWLKYDNTWHTGYEPKYLWKMTATENKAAYEMRSQKFYDQAWPIYAPYGNKMAANGKDYLFALSRKIASGKYDKAADHAQVEFRVMGTETRSLGGEDKEVVYVALVAKGHGTQAGKTFYLSTEDGNMNASGTGRRTYVHWLEVGEDNDIPREKGWWVVEVAPQTPEGTGDVPGRTLLYRTSALEYHYRIPSIVTANNGDVIVASDYRFHSNADVGTNWTNWDGEAWRNYTYGHQIDLHTRRSVDNGKNWEEAINRTEGLSVAPDFNTQTYANGYGDPAMVADRESDDVLLVSVSGYKGYVTDGNEASYMLSKDNGATFENPVNLSEQLYGRFNSNSEYYDSNLAGQRLTKFFFASGRIHQSRYIKVGTHYRIYSAVLANYTTNCNYVLYSDDFGKNWYVLGNTTAIPSGGDEAKIEELPNGDVVITSRIVKGRKVNIFKYDKNDATYKTGSWGTCMDMNIAPDCNNACNGETYVVYAKDVATGEYGYVILQSLPTSTGRSGVRIMYRWLDPEAELSVSEFADASKWSTVSDSFLLQDGKSCYSTMILQADGKIGVVWEEGVHEYDIVYKALDLTEITNNKYAIAFPSGGIGSKDTPYKVTTQEEIQAVQLVYANEGVNWQLSEKPDDKWGDIQVGDRVGLTDVPIGIWVAGIKDLDYTGSKQTQTFRVYDGSKLLTEGTDYTVSYKNNQNAYDDSMIQKDWKEMVVAADGGTKDAATKAFKAKAPQVVLKMKGTYSGSKTLYFQIKKANIEGEDFYFDNLKATYTGKKQKAGVTVLWNVTGKILKLNKEYTLKVEGDKELKDAESYSLILEGTGNFTGRITKDYEISAEKVSLAQVKVQVNKVAFKEGGAEPEEIIKSVKYGKTELKLGEDYTAQIDKDSTAVGTGYVMLTAKGDKYTGTRKVAYTITGISMSKVTVEGIDKDGYPYTGSEIRPTEFIKENSEDNGKVITVKYKTKTTEIALKEADEDYSVSYQKNKNKGTATIILTGNPAKGYTGSKKVSFKIVAYNLDQEDVTVTLAEETEGKVEYSQGGATPKVEVTAGGRVLTEGTDYTLSYKNNKAVGDTNKKPVVTVKGKGNYAKSKDLPFEITKKKVEEGSEVVVVVVNDKEYKAGTKNWKQSFKVVDGNGKVIGSKEYTAVYTTDDYNLSKVAKEVPAGSDVKITVTFNEDSKFYEGTVSGSFRMLEQGYDISKAKVKINGGKAIAYTGDKIELTAKDFAGTTLNKKVITEAEFKDIFTIVDYDNNINKGTAKVILRGNSDKGYGGEKVVTFKIGTRSIVDSWWENLKKAIFN